MPDKRVCIVCGENPSEVPDRNRMGRPIKRVCRQCHGDRLAGDLQRIMEIRKKRAHLRALDEMARAQNERSNVE